MISDQAVSADMTEPATPGTSMTYRGGKPFRRYLLWYTLAFAAITAVWGGMLGVLLPNQVQMIEFANWFTGADAGVDLAALNDLKAAVEAGTATATAEQQRLLDLLAGFDAARAQALSLVTALAVIATMVVQPVVGVLSDRTRSRFGRRAPWIVFGAVVGSGFLISVRYAPTIAVLALLWTCAQTTLNMVNGTLQTTVPDRVPEDKVGTTSGIGGLGNFAGGIVGGVGAGILLPLVGLNVIYAYAILVLIGVAGFVLLLRDRPSTDLAVAPHHWGTFFRGFLIPLRHHDFRWVWLSRILLTFGYAASTTFALFMLQSYISPALSLTDATRIAPLLTAASLPGTIVALLLAGRISDRIGRRKPLVIAASALMAFSMLVPLLWPSLPALFAQSILAGIAFGIYLPVDQALFIDVLPDRDAAGRDLGIAGLGSNLGQALGPVLAGQVVALTGGYRAVWAVALVLTAIAAVGILRVRNAK
ncbi:MFS transporter [Actinoplanes sp. CA-015351]|uniref:MFS transporter n=1 Tax=Actinoplanes sp. CA-015351 TaxID=3239897 RepID=UPI003D99D0CF